MMKWYETPAARAAFIALAYLVISIAIGLAFAGCSTLPKGVTMSPEEAKACEENGCTVWTMDELKNLARQFYLKGVQDGKSST